MSIGKFTPPYSRPGGGPGRGPTCSQSPVTDKRNIFLVHLAVAIIPLSERKIDSTGISLFFKTKNQDPSEGAHNQNLRHAPQTINETAQKISTHKQEQIRELVP